MELPQVENILDDQDRNIRYVVRAYRKLSEQELVLAVRAFLSMQRGRRPKRNTTYEIITVIGARDLV